MQLDTAHQSREIVQQLQDMKDEETSTVGFNEHEQEQIAVLEREIDVSAKRREIVRNVIQVRVTSHNNFRAKQCARDWF